MPTVISVENLSKAYHLGQIGTGTFTNDLKLWWAKVRGKPNPLLKIGETDHGNRDGEEIWALRDVSFTVEQGEVLGIIGRNGAGKSTLLKILSRVTAPTSGKINVKGRIASLLEVGTGFHPELTGRENIYLNGAILGMRRREIDRKFDEIVDFAEVEKFIDTPVKRYSSGMYVRLAFAVAAHLEPEILVVDEVLAVGDIEFQKKCLGKMGKVALEGRTVLFVSHNMAAVENLCANGIVLQKGHKIFESAISDAVNCYVNDSSNSVKPLESLDSKLLRFVKLSDSFGNDQKKLKIGHPIVFQVGLSPHPEFDISLGIGINNHYGTRVTTVQTKYTGFSIPATDDSEIVECRIDNLAIAPGEYGIKVAVASVYGQTIESLEEPSFFEIAPSDFWGYGHLPSNQQGIIMASHEWRVI
ncbi:MAG: ABC transporter ATP-binding protein [Chloroflexota bacterium]